MAPTGEVICKRCGKEERIIMGFFWLVWYCKECRPFLSQEEKDSYKASGDLCLSATKKILSNRMGR